MDLAYDVYETDDESGDCPVIMVHGWYWNSMIFSKTAKELAKLTRRKVYALDMRGHGKSIDVERQTLTMELLTEDLSHFLDTHSIPKASFVCHSVSSVFAHMLAVKQPLKVEKLVMVDHQPYRPLNAYIREDAAAQHKMQNRFLANLDPLLTIMEAKAKFRLQTCETKGQRAFMEKMANELIKVEGKFKWNIDLDYLYERCVSEDFIRHANPLELYEGPILIIRAKDSKHLTDSMFSDILKLNPNCKLQTSKQTSHLIPIDSSVEFLESVSQFLNTDE